MADKNPQYGFAHHVSDWDVIVDVLDAGSGGGNVAGNGIEFDLGWSTFYNDWIVAHNGFDIALPASEYLYEWLGELKKRLDTGKYNNSFAALWFDIKTPNAADTVSQKYKAKASMQTVLDLARANVPSSVAIIYDFGAKENFGFSGGSATGYNLVRQQLRPNEGIGIWAESGQANWISTFYNKLKQDRVVRTVMHHGHAVNIDENVLIEINKPAYHAQADPFRFKKVFTWTNALSSTMADYINPAHAYHTDGQIVGSPTSQWQGYFGELQDFDNAIATCSATQRKAVRSDNFWGRSGSDVAPFNTVQSDWRWCRKCQGLFFAGNPGSRCPADSGAHDPSGVGNNYLLRHNQPELDGLQSGWRWCNKCKGLFFGTGENSVCPAGGTHDRTGSGNYSLCHFVEEDSNSQAGWRWCNKCMGLFYAGNSGSRCPAGAAHDATGSGAYFLKNPR
jgi:hypothetical protein